MEVTPHVFNVLQNNTSKGIVLFLILFLFILKNEAECCSSGILEDNTAPCCYNFYRDGNRCKDCPDGYFGFNCSEMCETPSYGLKCAFRCECVPCHHIYGCYSATSSRGMKQYNHQEETTVLVETKGGDATNKFHETIVTVVRQITIPTGSIISLVLLLIITREGIRYRQEATQT